MSAGAGSNVYGDDDAVHDTCVACDSGENLCRGSRDGRLLACPGHLSTACRACFAVAKGGNAAAEEDDDDDEQRGMAKKEEVKVGEVMVSVVEEADALVWIGARQRGRSSTVQDARPAPTGDWGEYRRTGSESESKSQQGNLST
jgi:hypothetical protein